MLGEPGSGGSRCPGEGSLRCCPLPFGLLRWRRRPGLLLPGGSSCQLPAPARRPPAQLHSGEGRRAPPQPRTAEERGELWRFRVGAGGDSFGARWARTSVPYARGADAAPGGPAAASRARLSPRPPGLPSACWPARPWS